MQLTLSRWALPKGWPALAACMLIPAVNYALFATSFPLWVIPWINDFHVARSTVMSGFAVANLITGLTSPIVGRVLERIPVRLMMALGGVALASGFVLGSIAHSIWQVMALYASVMAVGSAFAGVLPAQSVAVRILPHRTGTTGGLITLGISAGGIVIPGLLVGPVAELGWRPAFVMAGALVLLTIVPLSWFLFKDHGGKPIAAQGEAAAAATDAAHGEAAATDAARLTIRALLGNPAFWVPIIASTAVLFVVGTVLTNSVAIAADSGIKIGVGGYLVPMIGAGSALGSVGLGWLYDRLDYRLLFAATAAAVVVALLLLLGHVQLLPMALAFAVVGFAGGGVFPMLGVMIVRGFGPHAFGRIMGMLMPMLIIAALAPVFAAWVRDRTGSYGIAFVFCAVLMIPSGLAVLLLRIPPRNLVTAVPDC
jgi:MFS family permease